MSSPSGARNRRPWQRHNRGDSMRATIFAIIVLAFGFQTDANAQQQPTLKDAYKGCFLVGAALNPAQFSGEDPLEDALIKAQFNTISPENVLKWEIVHPHPGTYDFSLADKYVEFGQQNHMFIIGHNLVWHSQVPKWVFEDEKGAPVTRDVLLERMRDHISKVVGRYKGRIAGWIRRHSQLAGGQTDAPNHHGERARHDVRYRPRSRLGRGRLPHEALRPGRVAGQGTSTHQARSRRIPARFAVRESGTEQPHARVAARRPNGIPHSHRIRVAGDPGAPGGMHRAEGGAGGSRMGRRRGSWRRYAVCVHPQPAIQDRVRRRTPVPAHGARGGVHAADRSALKNTSISLRLTFRSEELRV